MRRFQDGAQPSAWQRLFPRAITVIDGFNFDKRGNSAFNIENIDIITETGRKPV